MMWNWISNTNKTIEFWNEGQPENGDVERLCTAFDIDAGAWYSSECCDERPYVCRITGEIHIILKCCLNFS